VPVSAPAVRVACSVLGAATVVVALVLQRAQISPGTAIVALVLGCSPIVPYAALFRSLRWSAVGGAALFGITLIHAVRFVQTKGSYGFSGHAAWFLQSAILATLALVLLGALDRRERVSSGSRQAG
jgi:hypothetical protein